MCRERVTVISVFSVLFLRFLAGTIESKQGSSLRVVCCVVPYSSADANRRILCAVRQRGKEKEREREKEGRHNHERIPKTLTTHFYYLGRVQMKHQTTQMK